MGHEIAHHKRSINRLFGFVPQELSFYQELSPAENLAFFGAWSGLQKTEIKNKTDELLEVLDERVEVTSDDAMLVDCECPWENTAP